MEPEDLPWPGELEEEEEEEEEVAEEVPEEVAEEVPEGLAEEAENLDEDEVLMVEDVEEEEEGRELDADLNYESQPPESTDDEEDEEDEEAMAWLQAHPGRSLPLSSLRKHRYSEAERTASEKRPESWHFLPQEIDSSHTMDTTQTRINMREERMEVTEFPSVEEGILTQSENQVKEPNRDLFCSPLLVIQDSFASPDLPLLTCLTDQEFGPDSLFHQNELSFAPLRGIPGKSEDTEWFSRPSEVSEALFQATSEVASNFGNSRFSVSQHPLIGTTAVEPQDSFLPGEQGTKEETISSDIADKLKTPKDSDSYDALRAYMSWKTQEVTQEPETNLAGKDQVSFSTSSDTSDEYITSKESDSFDAACSYVQYWKQEAIQQSEKYLTSEDHDFCSDSSDTVDKNKISEGSDNFSAPFSRMSWSKQVSYHPETCLISKDCVSFAHEAAPHFSNTVSYSFLHCLLEKRRKRVPLVSDSYFQSVYLRAPAENELTQKMDSLEGYERNEEGLGKDLYQCFELKENSNTLAFSEVPPRSSEIRYIDNVVVIDHSVKVSETHVLSRGHDTSKVEASGCPLQTITSNLGETSEELYFQGERNQKASSAFGEKNFNATENVAFEAVIASIEPSKKESTVHEIQTAINKCLTNDSQERDPQNSELSLFSYNKNSFFDKFSHPLCHSTPGVFEPAASKPLLHKKDDYVSSLYWHSNLNSLPNAPQEVFIKPPSFIPKLNSELNSSASLSGKSHRQVVGLCKTPSALFQCDIDNEPFLPVGKTKSVPALDLAEKVGSSHMYPLKASTSDSLSLQDSKQQTFEEVADSSSYILAGLQGKAESDICTLGDDTECCSLDENAVTCSERVAELQREICDQSDSTGECIELAGLENLLDDLEICDSSLRWEPALQLPSKEDSCFEESVGHSNMDINQSFSPVLPPFVHEPARELEYHSSDLRMLRISPQIVPKTLKHLSGDTSKGGITEITQSNLKPGITTTPGDSHIGSHLPLSPVRSSVENTIDQHIDTLNQQILADGHVTEETLNVSAIPELADQNTGISTIPSGSNTQGEKPSIFYPQALGNSHQTEEALRVSAVSGPADQKTEKTTVPSSSYREKHIILSQQQLPGSHLVTASSFSHGEKSHIFFQQTLPESLVTEQSQQVSPVSVFADQKTGIPIVTSTPYSHREQPRIFYQQTSPESHPTEQPQQVSAVPGPAYQKTGIPTTLPTSYSHRGKTGFFYQQELPDSHLIEQAQRISAIPGPADQNTVIQTVSSSSYSHKEKPIIFYQQEFPDSHLTEEALKVSASPGPAEQNTGIPTGSSGSYSFEEKPSIFKQQTLSDSHLIEEALRVSSAPRPGDQTTGILTVPSSSNSHKEKPNIFYQQELPDIHLTEQAQKVSTISGSAEPKTVIPTIASISYSYREKPIFYPQGLADSQLPEEALKVTVVPGPADQKTGLPSEPSSFYSHREKPISFYQQALPDIHLTEEALKVSTISGQADQKTEIPTVPSTSYPQRDKHIIISPQALPDSHLLEEAPKLSAVPGPDDQKSGLPSEPSSSYAHREKPIIFFQQELPDSHLTEEVLKVSAASGTGDRKTGIPTLPLRSYSLGGKPIIFYHRALADRHLNEEALNVSASGPAEQKTGIPTTSSTSYPPREKPFIFYPQVLPDSQLTEAALKVSAVPGPGDQNTRKPTVTSASYSHREKPSISYQQELPGSQLTVEALKVSGKFSQGLPDKHLTEDALKVSEISGPTDQTIVLPTAPPSVFSHREKPDTFYQQDLPDRHLYEDALKFSGGLGQADQITGLSTVPLAAYSHSEKHKLVSDHVQKLIDNLDSYNSSIILNNMPLNSQADRRVVINKPEPSDFDNVGLEVSQDTENDSKTLKEIQTLLMEAENIALKRCNFPVPLVPFRDVSDISLIHSKKVVSVKEPPTADEYNVDLLQRQPFTEESPSNKCIQKEISTQTNLKCQRGIENWEFIHSTTVRSPLQEAESKARVELDETLRQHKAANSVMRSEPEGCSGTIGNKILIPVMTIIQSDSSSDASSCSWDSNSLESVSDVLLNFFPYASPKTSTTDSREEERMSESDDGGGSSVDSLAAHVKNLLQCESSLNHAKQILRNAEEEECRVRARAWNLKFNMAHECGYSISELNEDDRRKVEEIKAKSFGHGRTTDLSKGLQSPRGIGCNPETVCSHIIIESHEKGCFRTLTAEQPQLDSHPCVFRSAEPLEMLKGQRSPSSWRTRHINLSKSLDQSNPHFEAWNSLQLQSHSPFQNLLADDFKISKGFQMPFHEKMDPWLSELVEPTCVRPEEMDCHSSSQMLPPESMKKFTTSITFSSHQHSKCFSDSSVVKVGVTEGSQCSGASVGIFNSHFTEEQNPPRDLKQKTSSPPSLKIISHSPDKAVTILAESSRKGKFSVECSHQEEKLLERPDFKGSHSVPSTSTNSGKVKEVHFADNHTFINIDRPSSTLGVKEKNVTITPNLPSRIFLEQQELFEQSKVPHADHHVRKHQSPPPQHQDFVASNLPCFIFLEKRELLELSKAPDVDHQMRENHSSLPQGQDYIAPDLPPPIFLEQRQLFEQSKAPDVDHNMRKQSSPLPQGQDSVVENNDQHKPKSHISNMIDVEAKLNKVVSQSAPNQSPLATSSPTLATSSPTLATSSPTLATSSPTLATSSPTLTTSSPTLATSSCTLATSLPTLATSSPTLATSLSIPTPPSNKKALSFVHITLSPNTPSKLDSGTLDKRFVSLDPASKKRMNSEFNSDLQTISSRSLRPTTKLLTTKPVAQDQESLGFLGPKSSSDFQVVQSPLPDGNTITQDLKTIPSQNSQIVTSRQTQVNFSDLEGYPNPEGTPVSADRSLKDIKPPSSAFSGKFSSDAVTQITTESPQKTMFSSEIFINAEDCEHEIPEPSTQKLDKVPVKFASSFSIQQITVPRGTDGAQPSLLPYKPSGSTKMYYVPQLSQTPSFLDSKSDTTIESSHSGSNDAIAPDFPAQVLGTRDDDLALTVNIKHKEGIYSKRAVTKAPLSTRKKYFQKYNTGDAIISGSQDQVLITRDENLSDKIQIKEIYSKKAVTNAAQPEEKESFQKDTAGSSDAAAAEHSAQLQDTKVQSPSDTKAIKQKEEIHSKRIVPKEAWSENKESSQIDVEESRGHSEFENTTHSVFRSAKFYFHHPVHLPSDQDIGHESLGRSVFMKHSWKDFFQHQPDKQREHTFLPSPYQNEEKMKTDDTRIESLSIDVNLENKEAIQPTNTQAADHAKCDKPISEPKKSDEVTPEPTTQHTASLNELWNKYRERQKQQKPPGFSDRKELSLVERLDRLAKLLQNPITHSLQPSESTQDDSRGDRDAKEWSGRQQQQKNKLHKKKRYKSLEKCHKNKGDLKNKVLSTHQAGKSNHIKIEQVKFDKYVLRKQPCFHYINNTSSDSRPSEDSELLTDTATNVLSSTTSPVESDILTQTDREVTLHERSSSISTIDTARLIRAFGHERVCLSPRRINLYSSITDHQRRYIEKRSKNMKKALSMGYPQMTCEHTRRKHIQVHGYKFPLAM
ncbi:PREDICTED: Alstrom syndrome protein 1 [Hipposideros armiger]|uniref:Alstrom syndrome protein 1 n=1 Tax=Hipposideros armiger TaxID=186990 RepID=A0A8B7QMB4_HIPAR|nr:PREDICTED: Alstrom syndrome protein 1 [Hipposideros armiger]